MTSAPSGALFWRVNSSTWSGSLRSRARCPPRRSVPRNSTVTSASWQAAWANSGPACACATFPTARHSPSRTSYLWPAASAKLYNSSTSSATAAATRMPAGSTSPTSASTPKCNACASGSPRATPYAAAMRPRTLRAACLLPLDLARQTLDLVAAHPLGENIKVPRHKVWISFTKAFASPAPRA